MRTALDNGHLRPWGRTGAAVVGVAALVFLAVCVLPAAYMIAASLSGNPSDIARTYQTLLLDGRQRDLLLNTTALGLCTAIGATVVGVPLGFGLARASGRRTQLRRLALAAPLALPPYVVALAWVYVGGAAGLVAQTIGHDVLSGWTYSLAGAAGVLILVSYPLSMLATEAAVRRVDARLEEAALLVAPPRQVLARITLPLVGPSIGAAALLVFVLAVSDFGVPALLGVRVFTTEVFTAFAALYDFGRATVLTLPLLALAALVATAAIALVGDRLLVGRRLSSVVPSIAWGRRTTLGGMLDIAVLMVALVVPLLVLGYEATRTGPPAALADSGAPIVTSLILASLGATCIVAVGAWLGYARARTGRRAGRLADILFVVTFAVPSTVVGIGLIGLWNRPGLLGTLYGTDGMILVAYLARFVPVAALILAASVRQVPASHEEAAAVAGARWLRTVTRIVAPQVTLGLIAAWVVAFVLCFGELGATLLVAPPGESTLPVRIYTLVANAPASHLAALALLQSGVVLAPLVLLGLLRVRWTPR
ncbi:MAG TPA: ABC transporter permease subunit [Vicinamibacterales bacterium]|nr:ABC transporter permease subunit [Vicinamibacterales bacterium]